MPENHGHTQRANGGKRTWPSSHVTLHSDANFLKGNNRTFTINLQVLGGSLLSRKHNEKKVCVSPPHHHQHANLEQ